MLNEKMEINYNDGFLSFYNFIFDIKDSKDVREMMFCVVCES